MNSPCAAAILALISWGFSGPAFSAGGRSPTIEGPIAAIGIPGDAAHSYPFFASNHDLPSHAYLEQEFFIRGYAARYSTPVLRTGAIVDQDHLYKTRVLVRRPADSRRFNGIVLVEWLNVSNGYDADNAWFFDWEHALRGGYAWIGVSAQQVGVKRLKAWSPKRYGSLDVTEGGKLTDDSLSYDIYAQVAEAIRSDSGPALLGSLKPQKVIAIGESQSAGRLAAYINSVDPLNHVYDGFLLLSAPGRQIRSDLTVPVFKISTEYDVQAAEGAARQPDGPLFRAWEIAGSSHVDRHLRESREALELRDFGTSGEAQLAPKCIDPELGTTTDAHDVVGDAVELLTRWVDKGEPPPSSPKIETDPNSIQASTSPGGDAQKSIRLQRDALGIAEGGIRLADVTAPRGVNVGTNGGPGACVRWGYYSPFSVEKLEQLYPTHSDYVAKVEATTNDDVRLGFILQADARRVIEAAKNASIGGVGEATAHR